MSSARHEEGEVTVYRVCVICPEAFELRTMHVFLVHPALTTKNIVTVVVDACLAFGRELLLVGKKRHLLPGLRTKLFLA